MAKSVKGGARPGAGRPRGEQTTILQARVPQHLADWVRRQGGLRAVLERTQEQPDVDGLKIALTAAAASAERLAGDLPETGPETLSQAFLAGRAEGFSRAATLAKEVLEASK